MKLSKSMQTKMDEFINLPYADYRELQAEGDYRRINFFLKTGKIEAPYEGLLKDGTIRSTSTTGTLKALEKRGLIEIVTIGGDSTDRIRLTQHENKSVSLFDTHNLTKVLVYTNGYEGKESLNNTIDYIEDNDVSSVMEYWNLGCRSGLVRVVNAETGEEIYKA